MDYLDDFPEYFYYNELSQALADLQLSRGGIHEIMSKTPLSKKEDRVAIRHILVRLLADAQKPARIIDLVWEHILTKMRELGFSQKGVTEIANDTPLTTPADTEVLLDALSHWLVRNEARVPMGYPPHLRALWKRKQLELHGGKKDS